MSLVLDGLFYTKEHEWVKVEDGIATIGITDHAQSQLGDIVFTELPAVGDEVTQMLECGVVESVKTASDLFSPVSGEVSEVNSFLLQEIDGEDNDNFHPEYVNTDPYNNGWMIKIKLSKPEEVESLLSAEEYKKLI
jgi:glycine cleavage system H protein